MADVEITLGFSAEEAQELAPMFEQMARGMSRLPKALAILAAREVASVDDLTPRQQAKLVLHMTIKAWKQQYKRREAEITYGETAADTVENTYEVEVD